MIYQKLSKQHIFPFSFHISLKYTIHHTSRRNPLNLLFWEKCIFERSEFLNFFFRLNNLIYVPCIPLYPLYPLLSPCILLYPPVSHCIPCIPTYPLYPLYPPVTSCIPPGRVLYVSFITCYNSITNVHYNTYKLLIKIQSSNT